MKVRLAQFAPALSGDKGDRADIGLFAYDEAGYAVLKREVTSERVAEHFRWIAEGPVERYPLDNILAIKFVLNSALQGGAARSVCSDNLGKTIAAALLRMEIEISEEDTERLACASAKWLRNFRITRRNRCPCPAGTSCGTISPVAGSPKVPRVNR